MNALILYDEIRCVRDASQVLQHAAYNANLEEPWHLLPWRTDIIRFPAAADTAMAEAMSSDLIVFAGPQINSSLWLGEWLERWVRLREVEDAALMVINGADTEELSGQTAPWLSEFAARHGLALIAADLAANDPNVHRQNVVAELPRSEVGQGDPNRMGTNHCHGTNQ